MTTTAASIASRVRPDFPALRRTVAGLPVAHFDGPGGTQVPERVAAAVAAYLLEHNANEGWAFATSRETDAAIARARTSVAALVGAESPQEMLFGANMTTLAFHLARAVGRSLRPGDEIVVTDLDHHANIDPWVALERDYGAVVKRVPLLDRRPQLDFAAFERLLGPRTRLVALGLSSNAFGTVNPVAAMASAARAFGALVFVDAVHAAAHTVLDVNALGADMLAFSAYKLYGPHVGVAYCRSGVLAELDFPRVAPQRSTGSKRGESGTLNHEGIVGTDAALEFLAGLGAQDGASPRERLRSTMSALALEEDRAFRVLAGGLRELPNVTTYEPPAGTERHPTIAFTVRDRDAQSVAAHLGEHDAVFVSHGNFYAATAVPLVAPGAIEAGGLVRAGVGIYTTVDEAERLVAAVARL